MTTKPYWTQIEVTFRSKLADADLIDLISADVHDSLYQAGSAVLKFRDDYFEIPGSLAKVGDPVSISAVSQSSKRSEIFSGEVTGLEIAQEEGGRFTVVQARDRAHSLLTTRRVIAFSESTVADMAKKVVDRVGLTLKEAPQGGFRYPHFSQAYVTDWDFLQILARLSGTVVRVAGKDVSLVVPEPASKGVAVASADASSAAVLDVNENVVSLRASVDAVGQTGVVTVRGWDVEAKKEVKVEDKDVASANDLVDMAKGVSPGKSAEALKVRDSFLVASGCTTTDAATKNSKTAGHQLASRFFRLDATTTVNSDLAAGTVITVKNAGDFFSGRYTCTNVHHVYSNGAPFLTKISVEPVPVILSGVSGAGYGSGQAWGVGVALVTDVKAEDEESGQVRLRFPWLSEEYVSDWVRTMQLGGGGVFLPDVEDEVLVAFEQGRLDRPVVLGPLFNGVDKPVQHEGPLWDRGTGHVNRRSIASRAGDRLELLDEKDENEGIRMVTDSSSVFLNRTEPEIQLTCEEGTVSVTAKKIHFNGTEEITFNADKITVEAGAEFSLSGENTSVNGTERLRMSSDSKVTIEAPAVDIN